MELWKIIQVALLASIKYLFTLPYAIIIGLDHQQATIAIILGGIIGFLFFYYASGWIIRQYKRLIHILWGIVPSSMCIFANSLCLPERKKPISRKNRMVYKIMKKWGLPGIIITTPVLLSIPLGAFLANKYYRKHTLLIPYMMASIIGWGLVISVIIKWF
jgi:hypothetical protein